MGQRTDGATQTTRRAAGELFEDVYEELRRVAAAHLRRERAGHTLQPTALVHEVYLKMAGRSLPARERGPLIGVASRAMRQILVDHARRMGADKRGGAVVHTTLRGKHLPARLDAERLLDLDRAMATLDERQRRVVELRFFAGLEEREVADILGVTERTIRRDWVKARAWLYASLYAGEEAEPRMLSA